MTTTLEELLKQHPKAVKAIGIADYKQRNRLSVIVRIKDYAYANSIGDHAMDSVADLLAAIEAHITASEPLGDEEIEAMKWKKNADDRIVVRWCGNTGVCEGWNDHHTKWLFEGHNADIDRLHAEIRRLRKGDA